MLRMRDLPRLRVHAPASWLDRAVHLDPDLTSGTATYGDNCRRAGRAFSLRSAQRGDVIFFLARLQPRDRPASFHLVGFLEIADALIDVTHDPGPGWWDGNAHIRRARATDSWDSFWVFKGGARSHFVKPAVAFNREEAEKVLPGMRWPAHRTELQTIGSYTRAVRRLEGTGEEWLRATCLY